MVYREAESPATEETPVVLTGEPMFVVLTVKMHPKPLKPSKLDKKDPQHVRWAKLAGLRDDPSPTGGKQCYHVDMVRAETKFEALKVAMENVRHLLEKIWDLDFKNGAYEVVTSKDFGWFDRVITISAQRENLSMKKWWKNDRFKIMKEVGASPNEKIYFITKQNLREMNVVEDNP